VTSAQSTTESDLYADQRAAALELADDPHQERWMIAAYEEGSTTLEGDPTPVCRVQGPSTSSQGIEVVPLIDLAHMLVAWRRQRDKARSLEEALRSIKTYLRGDIEQHRAAGRACGEDACIICLACATAEEALR
jgi:hypothetical protein